MFVAADASAFLLPPPLLLMMLMLTLAPLPLRFDMR